MADDDEVQGAPGSGELFAPTGPRRASFTPAPDNAESREAAANLFNDDAIAEALSAELAKVATGPIPIRRITPAAPVAETSAPEPQAPVEAASEPAEVAPEPASAEPVVASAPEPIVASAPEPVVASAPEPVVASAPEPIVASAPEPVVASAPEPVVASAPAPAAPPVPGPVVDSVPEWPVASEPDAEPASVSEPAPQADSVPDWTTAPTPEPAVAADPEPIAPAATPEPTASSPQGPPDWATPLFGQPTPPAETDEPQAPRNLDPFAPSAPSFAPSTGPFPPPGDSTPAPEPTSTPFPTEDPEALRALYSAAPAPTVPAADAPPPPGYDAAPPADSAPTDHPASATLSAIEQLQAQLDQRDREAREYAAWESSMIEVGTPEALAAVDQARAERAGISSAPAPAASAPQAPEPGADPAPLTEEPAAFLPPPVDEPAAFLPPPADDVPSYFAPPADQPPTDQFHAEQAPTEQAPVEQPSFESLFTDQPGDAPIASAPVAPDAAAFPFAPAEQPVVEPTSFLPPPADEPTAFAAPPADEPAAFGAPAQEPAAFLPPPAEESAAFLPPPAEEPAAFLPPPAEESAAFLPPPAEENNAFPPPSDDAAAPATPSSENPFDIFAASIDSQPQPNPADLEPSPFPGFAPPTDATPTDFEAPADPHELTFAPAPSVPDAPVFLEPAPPTSVPSPPGPPSWNIDEPSAAQPSAEEYAASQPTPDEFAAAGAPPALVEPPTHDGVADLWRTASEADVQPPAPTPVVDPLPSAPVSDAPAPTAEPAFPSAPAPVPTAMDLASAPPPSPFDDLLVGGDDPPPVPPPSPGLLSGDPNPFTEPDIDAATGERRPFGEGVVRDQAVDPSDSIFGAPRQPVSVNTEGVAVVPETVVVESQPISVVGAAAVAAEPALVAPRIPPAEPVGLEPTPLDQRVGRAARLFWLWFAANSSIAAIVFGAILFALGVSLRQAVVATLAGVALSFLPLGLGTLAGKRSGQPTMVISRATFGVVGNILPALIALFSRLFWAAGLLWVLGAGIADILHGAKLTDGFTTGELTIIFMAIGFLVAIVLAYFGYALISKVQLVISVISGVAIVGFIALTVQYVDFTVALSTPDGPWILVVTGAVLVFSFVGLAWANSSADVARYQRVGSSGAASVLWASFGVALPSFLLIAYGALLAASNGKLAARIAADPLYSLGRLLPAWYPGPLLAATALSLLSGIILALYSGGFALQAAGLRLRRSLSTLIVGLLTLFIALFIAFSVTNFSELFRDLATTVAVPVAAWAGIFGAEIMMRKRRFDSWSLLNRGGVYQDVRWGNLVALVVITVLGYGFLTATMTGLGWEGYLFSALGVPLNSAFATSDIGVLMALVLGLLFPLAAGHSGIRAQESAVRVPE